MSMWLPLENNPDVMNKYIKALGADEAHLEFTDVFGTSPELLEMVPQPVKAVLLVYPISKASEEYCRQKTTAQEAEVEEFMKNNKVFYTKQYVANACGTIGILHALLNNGVDLGSLREQSPLAALAQDGKTLSEKELGKEIENMKVLGEVHAAAALQGDSANQDIHAPINLHFVCFVAIGGRCVELDGRQKAPMLHGNCTDSVSFLAAAASAIEERMKLDTESLEYSITALVGTDN